MKTWLALNRHFKELVDACTVFNFICQELSTYTFLLGTIFYWINLHFLGVVKTVIFLWALNQHIEYFSFYIAKLNAKIDYFPLKFPR